MSVMAPWGRWHRRDKRAAPTRLLPGEGLCLWGTARGLHVVGGSQLSWDEGGGASQLLARGDGGRLDGRTDHGQTAFPCLDAPGGARGAAAAIGDALRGAAAPGHALSRDLPAWCWCLWLDVRGCPTCLVCPYAELAEPLGSLGTSEDFALWGNEQPEL